MEDLERLLEPYGVDDLATVHRMIAQARQVPLVRQLPPDPVATDGPL